MRRAALVMLAMATALVMASGVALAQPRGGDDVCVSHEGQTIYDHGPSTCSSNPGSEAVAINGSDADAQAAPFPGYESGSALAINGSSASGSFGEATAINNSVAQAVFDESTAINDSSVYGIFSEAYAVNDSHIDGVFLEAYAVNHSEAGGVFGELYAVNHSQAFANDLCTATALNGEVETCP